MNKELLKVVTEMMKPHPVYLVGGAVRDYLMGEDCKDYDFCTAAEPDEIERLIKVSKNKHGDGRKVYEVGKRFGTLGVKVRGEMVEITTFRSEEYKVGDRKPKVAFVKSLHEDLSRRDFTINAMALRLCKGNVRIIDPFGGGEDIENRILKSVGSAKTRFKEDPLRILRAVRFGSRFGFNIEEKTLKKMKSGSVGLLDISKERWVMEMDKILMCDDVDHALDLLWGCDIFRWILPELHLQDGYDQNSEYHDFKLNVHTSLVVKECPKILDLRWAALLHDVAKPFVRVDKIVKMVCDKTGIDLNAKSRNPVIKSNYVGHEKLGAEMVLKIAGYMKWSKDRTILVAGLVRRHLEENSVLRKYDNAGKRCLEDE